jgi:hypothetical protein
MKKRRFLRGSLGGLIAVCALFTACPVEEAAQNDAGLKELWINGKKVQFSAESEYTVYEGRMHIRAVPADSGAAVAVFPAQASADSAGLVITAGNSETVRVRVTARDQETVEDYTVTVTRGAGSIDLQSLTASYGALMVTLTPEFYPDRTGYTLQAPYRADSIAITARPEDTEASIAFSGDSDENGSVSFGAPSPEVKAKQVKITVKLDGTGAEKTYTIDITRAAKPGSTIEGNFGIIEDNIKDYEGEITLTGGSDPQTYKAGQTLIASFPVTYESVGSNEETASMRYDDLAGCTGFNWYRGSGGSLGLGTLSRNSSERKKGMLTLRIFFGEQADYSSTGTTPDAFSPLEPGTYNLTLRFEQIKPGERVFYSQTVSFTVVEEEEA